MSFSKGLRSKETGELLHTYLRLLGYREDKHVKVLGNPNVFEHPHQREFILVMRFLLGLLDEKEAESTFRHCYPPLDKKHEAEFRSKAFKWYKSLQTNNPELLVPVTSSLFLSPGGPKFMHFLMSFVAWISLQIIRRHPKNLNEEILSPAFITSPDLSASSKARYLKFKADEFQRAGFQMNKEAEALLNKGKELIQDLELKYRKDKASIDSLTAQKTNHAYKDLLNQRIELEERVTCVGSRMNQMLKQLDEDLNTIHSIQGKKSEALNVSDCLNNKTSLKKYVNEATNELSSMHESADTNAKGMLTLSEVVSDLLPKVNRLSLNLNDSLLNLNQGIIPKSTEEVNQILSSLSKFLRPPEEPDKCLLPPTPIVDIMATRNETSIDNSILNTTTSPSVNKRNSRENSDTPCSRNTTRSFSKKNSPIISLKPIETTQSFIHLEDSGSDLRCISTFSPVLSSSRMLSSVETRESSPTLGSVDQSTKSDYSNKTYALLEKYRNMKLQESDHDRGGKVISSSTNGHDEGSNARHQSTRYLNSNTPFYKPIRLRSSLSQCKPLKEDEDYPSPSCDVFDDKSYFDSEVKRISKLEELIEGLSQNNSTDKQVNHRLESFSLKRNSMNKENEGEGNCFTDFDPKLEDLIEGLSQNMSCNSADKQVNHQLESFSFKRKSMNNNEEDGDEIPLPPFNSFRFNQVDRRHSLLNSEAFIGSRLESLIETLGGNEDIHSLTEKFELPNFDL